MTDVVSATKAIIGAATATAIGAVPVAMEGGRTAETVILGVPQSVLLCAIVGVLVAYLFLPERDAERLTPDPAVGCRRERALQTAKRLGMLFLFLAGHAVVAAWVAQLAAHFFPALGGGPQLPLAGISGLVVRRFLPRYLRFAERVTDPLGGPKP